MSYTKTLFLLISVTEIIAKTPLVMESSHRSRTLVKKISPKRNELGLNPAVRVRIIYLKPCNQGAKEVETIYIHFRETIMK